MDQDHGHNPVLLDQTMALLGPRPGDVAVDCTAGRGGHAVALARAIGSAGRLVVCDLDAGNLAHTVRRLEVAPATAAAVPDSFVALPRWLEARGWQADVVLADLGFSSNQMDDPNRGFSFRGDGPLDMRLDPDGPTTAADLVATMDEAELARIIHQYGEEPLARKIARILVRNRRSQPILTTAQMARLVVEAYGPRAAASRMHPATRTFMALRIAVNDELGAVGSLMDLVVRGAERVHDSGWLAVGARVAVISFHSLEDRIVKRAFSTLERQGLATRLTRRPVTATEDEIRANPRARSAKLRVARMADPQQP